MDINIITQMLHTGNTKAHIARHFGVTEGVLTRFGKKHGLAIGRAYKAYTDQDVIDQAAKVKSIAGLLRALNIKEAGGNYANMKRKLSKLEVNTDHWTGQGWSKDQQTKDWSNYTRASSSKPHLIKLRGHKCESCKLEEWLDLPIMLEIHHIDGDRTNNCETNLQLLCPNCHSTTDNWRNKKRS